MLKLFNDTVLKPKTLGNKPSQQTGASQVSSRVLVEGEAKHIKPIIIVPSALTSVITSLNCIDFLGGHYISSEEKRSSGAQRVAEQEFKRPVPGHNPIQYRVLDNPLTLKDEDWENVAAVFATGQAWQFKDWNNKKWSQPSELFSHVLGLHVMMDDRVVSDTVKSWGVKVLKLNQTKRHLDLGAINDFWKALDTFIKLRKPHLPYGV